MSSDCIDGDGQVAWIAEHADLPLNIVRAVLELELEYMVAVGIADAPGYELRYYSPTSSRARPKRWILIASRRTRGASSAYQRRSLTRCSTLSSDSSNCAALFTTRSPLHAPVRAH